VTDDWWESSEWANCLLLEIPEGWQTVAHADPVGVGTRANRDKKAPAGATLPT